MNITNDVIGVAYKGIMFVSNFEVFGQLTRELMCYDRQTHNIIKPKLTLFIRK